MRKLITTFLSFLMVIFMGFGLSSCNIVISGTIDEIAGTYVLEEKN